MPHTRDTPTMPASVTPQGLDPFFDALAEAARASRQFQEVAREHGIVRCTDPIQPDAEFRIAHEEGKLWVMWASRDRYLSQSIEAEVKWTGDDIDELIAEEVESHGWTGGKLGPFQHFRSPEKFYVFRSELPIDPSRSSSADAQDALLFLKAYQAAFRNLGDMKAEED